MISNFILSVICFPFLRGFALKIPEYVKITPLPMLSLDFIKNFVLLALVPLFFSSCRYWQKAETETPGPTPFAVKELKSEIPFSTREPEVFQTEIVVTTNGQERKTFVAQNGANRRFDFNFGSKNQVSVVQTDKNYLLLPDKKIYAENLNGEKDAASESWADFLTTEWLNAKTEARFERLETEGNLTKYLVRLGAGDLSEILIYVDEAQGFPVRQEFYSTGGGQKILTYSVELKNLKLQTDDNLFAVPKDYRQVSEIEFRKILRDIQE